MKTLKELYEIVKAAGGDFPFSVANDFGQVNSVLFFGKHMCFVVRYDGGEYLDSKYNHGWQFPKDSPYLSKLDPVVYATADSDFKRTMDEFKIKRNRQRWEDLGKPWGRLKAGAKVFLDKDEIVTFIKFDPNIDRDCKISTRKDNGDWFEINPDYCELADKTLLHLDDWLLPAQAKNWKCKCLGEGRPQEEEDDQCKYCGGDLPIQEEKVPTQSPCNFCKGKKSLTWKEQDLVHFSNNVVVVKQKSMPCPYCNPGEFE